MRLCVCVLSRKTRTSTHTSFDKLIRTAVLDAAKGDLECVCISIDARAKASEREREKKNDDISKIDIILYLLLYKSIYTHRGSRARARREVGFVEHER